MRRTMTVSSTLSKLADGTGVRAAIANASQRTGVDFNYLLGQAQIESGLRAGARAATSSATGLFQFVDQSWLAVLAQHGEKHGLGWAAGAIRQGAGGRYYVADPALRSTIMNLRKDPASASLMAAAHASDNAQALEQCLGREANGTDLYICHFLGQAGGKSFLSALSRDGGLSAAAMFPAAARANRSVFYGANGARSLAEVYQRFSDKLGNGVQLAGNALPAGSADTATLNRLELARIQATPPGGAGGGDLNVLRPNPGNARLAYLMLASLGN
jgi:hypothetical protein